MMTQKTIIYLVAALCFVASQARAQVIVNQGVPVTATDANGQQVIINSQQQPQPVQGPQQTAPRVNVQPTTVVQSTPVESRADQLRKQREAVEVNTEQRITEKLEESRLNDEKSRAERLFGNPAPNAGQAVDPSTQQQVIVVQPAVQPVQQPVQPQPVQQVQPVQAVAPAAAVAPAVVAQPAPAPAVEAVKAEVKQDLKPGDDELRDKMYVSGGLGTSQYYGAINVSSNSAVNLAFGWQPGLNPRLNYEGTFMYSNYYINEYWKPPYVAFKEMSQYNFGGAIKYAFTNSAFRPYAGGLVSYTYRTYSNRGGPCLCQNWPTTMNSSAVDAGVLIGADYKLTRDFAVGLEYRYIMNLWARSDDRYIKPEYLMNGTTPIENMSYYSFMLIGKYTF